MTTEAPVAVDAAARLPEHILALNSGSSSLKYALYRVSGAASEALLAKSLPLVDAHDALRRIAAELAAANLPAPHAIGHRIVHGGSALRRHCRIDTAVLRHLAAAATLAPLHAPRALALIEHAQTVFPGVPQVACFDACFHAEMADVASVLPLARELQFPEIRRFGFHGLSCESIVAQLAHALPARLIIAHLGSGASVTAVDGGRSIDTTMGLTPTGGLMMGTRSGDLDPGVIFYLLRAKGFDAATLEDSLNRRSGLLGISGVASDLRQLRHTEERNPDATLAIDMFCYAVAKQIAAMMAALEGIDCIVFTGGIGEHDAGVRAEVCGRLAFAGVHLDEARNRARLNPISAATSKCTVLALTAAEDLQIARHAAALIAPLHHSLETIST